MTASTRALALALACLVALAGARGRALADDDPREDARRAFLKGEEQFLAGDYQGAIVYFRTSDAIVPSPVASYNVALAYERLGDADGAVKALREYLERAPTAPNRVLVEERIARLTGAPAARTPELYEDDATGATPAAGPAEDPFWQRIPVKPAGPPPPSPTPDGPFARDAPLPPEPAQPGPARDQGSAKAETPIYKEWWFWAILGVSAIVIYDAATTDGDSPTTRQNGAILLSF